MGPGLEFFQFVVHRGGIRAGTCLGGILGIRELLSFPTGVIHEGASRTCGGCVYGRLGEFQGRVVDVDLVRGLARTTCYGIK